MANQEDIVHRVKNKHCSTLLKNSKVNYVGVSFKITAGESTSTPAIQVAVKKKLPLEHLHDHEIIPTFLDGVPTDVIEGDLDLVKLGDILNQNLQLVSTGNEVYHTATVETLTGNVDPFAYNATITSCMSLAKYREPMKYGTVGCFMTVTESPKLPGIKVDNSHGDVLTCSGRCKSRQ